MSACESSEYRSCNSGYGPQRGLSSRVHMVAVGVALLATAVRPPVGPVGTGAPRSVSSVEMYPLGVPNEVLRTCSPAGAVQDVVADDLSAQ